MDGAHSHHWEQVVFDGAEAATDALHHQAGCETALRQALEPLLARHPDREQIIWALVESLAHFRNTACAEVSRMQAASMGRLQ